MTCGNTAKDLMFGGACVPYKMAGECKSRLFRVTVTTGEHKKTDSNARLKQQGLE